MSGKEKSATIKQMEDVEAALDDYESSSGLPININPGNEEELQEYLNMDRDKISKLSCLDCGEISIRLAQFSIYIQRLFNREAARVTWATTTIDNSVAPLWNNYDKYLKYDIKVALIGQENEYISKLNKIISYAKQRMNRLEYISSGIKYMSEVLIRQQQYKKKANEYE